MLIRDYKRKRNEKKKIKKKGQESRKLRMKEANKGRRKKRKNKRKITKERRTYDHLAVYTFEHLSYAVVCRLKDDESFCFGTVVFKRRLWTK